MRRTVFVVSLGVYLVVLATAASAQQLGEPIVTPPGPVPGPTTTHVDVTVQAPPPDPKFVQESSEGGFIGNVAVLAPIPGQWLKAAVDRLPNLWTQTPPLPDGVRHVSDVLRQASAALAALFIFLAGLAIVTGRSASLADDLFWRFVFATFVAFNNLAWWDLAINLNNSLCAAIATAPDFANVLTGHLLTTFQQPELAGITDAAVALLAGLVLAIVYAVVGLLVLLTLLLRLALVYLCAGAGSLALFFYALPRTEGIASWYVRFSAGTLFSQVAITIGFATANAIVSLASDKTVAVLLSIVVLLVVRRIPSIMQQLGSGAGQGIIGAGVLAAGLRVLRRGI